MSKLPETEAELWKMVGKGDTEAREKIILKYH